MIAAFALAACGGTGGAPPLAGPAAQAPSVQDDGQITNISGQYTGTIKDSENGKGKASLNLAQYRNGAGGTFTVVDGRQKIVAITAYLVSGSGWHGSIVAPVASVNCVFTQNAKYDTATHVLAGSYRAPHGCNGESESGTYMMKRQCYYARDWAARPENGLKQC
jgi:hypothetical protein